jgi:flagellar L-ring protein FlgH
MYSSFRVGTVLIGFAVAGPFFAMDASAQNGSLFQRPISYQGNSAFDRSAETLPAPQVVPRPEATNSNGMSGAGSYAAPFLGSASSDQRGTLLSPAIPPNTAVPQAAPSAPNPMSTQPPRQPMLPVPTVPQANLLGLQTSWTYTPPASSRAFKLHDIVSVRIEEASTSLALGNATSRKTTSYDAVLRDWVRLVGLDTIKPAPQADGDPRVQSIQNEVYRGDSTIRTSQSMTTNIAAEIVDIRPNGQIVLSARKTITENDNTFEWSLTGICRGQDILPDNTILSRNLIEASINKQERGHVRDGYSRGWLTKFIAFIKPF